MPYDLLIVGSGEAGKYLAWTMAHQGWRTAMVERRMVGGSCPNVACLPSKNVIHSARVASLVKRAEEFGVTVGPSTTDMRGVFRRKQAMVDDLRRLHYERYASAGVDLIMGEARFISPGSLAVRLAAGGETTLTAERIVISVGSRAAIPAIPGLDEAKPMTHVEALDLERLPKHLIIIGGSYVGLEFAQALRRLGSLVTVVEKGPRLASREDPDVSAALLDLFRDEGIEVLSEATVQRVEGVSGSGIRVHVSSPGSSLVLEGSDILVAAGRVPNTDSLGLELADVVADARGYIVVNERLATTAPNIWAVGDCAGSPQFTHAAYDDFRVLTANFTGVDRTTHGRLVPSCLFTDPELARIGLDETRARRSGTNYRLFSMPMSAVLRTRTISEPRGFMKMLVDIDADRILGFTAFGAEASELLAAVQTAMLGGLPYTVLRDGIFTHPTISEGLVFLLSQAPALRLGADAGAQNGPSPKAEVLPSII